MPTVEVKLRALRALRARDASRKFEPLEHDALLFFLMIRMKPLWMSFSDY